MLALATPPPSGNLDESRHHGPWAILLPLRFSSGTNHLLGKLSERSFRLAHESDLRVRRAYGAKGGKMSCHHDWCSATRFLMNCNKKMQGSSPYMRYMAVTCFSEEKTICWTRTTCGHFVADGFYPSILSKKNEADQRFSLRRIIEETPKSGGFWPLNT